MLTFARAVFLHGIQVLLLRHDGKGLPESKGAIYSILIVAIVAGVISDWLLHNNFPAAVTMAVFGLIGTMAFAYAYPPTLAPIACALVVSQSGSIVLTLAGVGSFLPKCKCTSPGFQRNPLPTAWAAQREVVTAFDA